MNFVDSVRMQFPRYFHNAKVLEVGSLDINGSVRRFFHECDYLGVDIGMGNGVDLVQSGHLLTFPAGHFDTSISCECFEHNKYWAETFSNMARMTNGLVIMTCATTGRPEHGTIASSPKDAPFTNDYYRNLTEHEFLETFNMKDMFLDWQFTTNQSPADLYFWGLTR
jgi:hypothetical protein